MFVSESTVFLAPKIVFKFAVSSNEAAGNKENEFWFFLVNDRSAFNISVTGVFVDAWNADTKVPAFVSTRDNSCPVVGKLVKKSN